MTDPSPAATTTDDDPPDGPVDPPDEPAGPPNYRRRWVIALVAAGLVVVLVAAGVLGTRIAGIWGPSTAVAVEVAPEPTEPPSPFDGTPAEDFAEGADGIVLPEAEPVGDFTAEEVAEALELVREALIAARLDHTMLVDHDPEHFLSLLAPDHRPGREEQFESGDFGEYATHIAPDVVLAQFSPRVDGEVSYGMAEAGARNTPVIEVSTSYIWVYPFESTSADRLAAIRDELVWEVAVGRPWSESSHGLWLAFASHAWAADCTGYGEGLLRPSRDGGPDTVIFDVERTSDFQSC